MNTQAPSIFASGKAILFGEHAAVYGQPALAAALDIGIQVHHVSQKIGQESLIIDTMPWSTRTRPDDGTPMGQALGRVKAAVEAECGPVPPASIVLKCSVPSGAGLGSSAALAVVMARQLIAMAPNPPQDRDALVMRAAEAAEAVFHGTPSGVDHTTSAKGGVLHFQRGAQPAFRKLAVAPFPIIIAMMEEGGDTGQMVAGVRKLRDAEPTIIDPLITLMGRLTLEAETALLAGDNARLGRLMNIAHGALCSLGVSTAALDKGCSAAREGGAWGAKLTGAGGGGCIIALAPEAKKFDVIHAIQSVGAIRIISSEAGVPAT